MPPPPWCCQVPKDAIILPVNNYGENYLRVGGWVACLGFSDRMMVIVSIIIIMVVPPPCHEADKHGDEEDSQPVHVPPSD